MCSGFGELGASLLSRKRRDFAGDTVSQGLPTRVGKKQPAEREAVEPFTYVYLFEGRAYRIGAARAHELKQDCSTLFHGGAGFNISHFAKHVRGLST